MEGADRRRHPRYDTGIPVTLLLGNARVSAYMIDFSPGGMCVLCEREAGPGTTLDILISRIEEVPIHGKVRWSAGIQEGCQMGIAVRNMEALTAVNHENLPSQYRFIKNLPSG